MNNGMNKNVKYPGYNLSIYDLQYLQGKGFLTIPEYINYKTITRKVECVNNLKKDHYFIGKDKKYNEITTSDLCALYRSGLVSKNMIIEYMIAFNTTKNIRDIEYAFNYGLISSKDVFNKLDLFAVEYKNDIKKLTVKDLVSLYKLEMIEEEDIKEAKIKKNSLTIEDYIALNRIGLYSDEELLSKAYDSIKEVDETYKDSNILFKLK